MYKPWNASSYEMNGDYSVTLVLADNHDGFITKAMLIHNIDRNCHIEDQKVVKLVSWLLLIMSSYY